MSRETEHTAETDGQQRPRAPLRRQAAGFVLGVATALGGLVFLLTAGAALSAFLLWPRSRPWAHRVLLSGAVRLTELERRRRIRFFGDTFPPRESAERTLGYLGVRTVSGLLAGLVLSLLLFGCVLAATLGAAILMGRVSPLTLVGQTVLGGVLLFLNVQAVLALAALDGRQARQHFGPSETEALELRIGELAVSRAELVEAVDAERRRIERDLHDGVQQRLVALAVLLGRTRRHSGNPELAAELLDQAHRQAGEALSELREVAWRAYPQMLDGLGLQEALEAVAARSAIPVTVTVQLPTVDGTVRQPPALVRTAVYFVVSESVTNAVKHSGADWIETSVRTDVDGEREGETVRVRVRDGGVGGADPSGSGLSGLRGRVAALDGRLTVDSPRGGPTTVTVELPCA